MPIIREGLRKGSFIYDATSDKYYKITANHSEFVGNNSPIEYVEAVDGHELDEFATASHNHDATYCRWRGSSATDPTNPLGGDQYYNTSTSKARYYTGSAWIDLN